MSYSHLDGKTLFLRGPANVYGDTRPPISSTVRDIERFGTLKVDQSGKAVTLKPIGEDSWIGFAQGEPEKFRENKNREEFTYRGEKVVPDFVFTER